MPSKHQVTELASRDGSKVLGKTGRVSASPKLSPSCTPPDAKEDRVYSAFGADIDYAMLIKLYGAPPESDTRYSPSECIGVQTHRIQGNPEFAHISTSYLSGKISPCGWPCAG